MQRSLSYLRLERPVQENKSPRVVPVIYSKSDERGNLLCLANTQAFDLDRRGCYLKLYHRLALGDIVNLELWLDTGAVREMRGRIMWLSKQFYRETWLTRIKFISKFSN